MPRPPSAFSRTTPSAFRLIAIVLFGVNVSGCDGESASPVTTAASSASAPAANAPAASAVPTYDYEVVNTFPHDPQAFTQGLVFHKGILLESTGLNGHSSLRKVDLTTGRVRQQRRLSAEYFAEGMTVLNGKIYQLTWQNGKAFAYDLATLEPQKEFSYSGEGWGLTTDGTSLIMSDGTHTLKFIDPITFKVIRTLDVFDHSGAPLKQLNELEYVRGEVYANVWQTPYIARIDPSTGRLLGVINFAQLLPPQDRFGTDVFNGIAYDATADRLFVTGKYWPKLFEVRLKPR